MELWFLGAAAALLSIAIVYASVVESKRVDALEKRVQELPVSALIVDMKNTRTRLEKEEGQLEELFTKFLESHGAIGKRFETFSKEFEVMSIRQRTLEKKIIEANRTVNLIFGKPIPVQMEHIPHTIIKEKKGRGRSALIDA